MPPAEKDRLREVVTSHDALLPERAWRVASLWQAFARKLSLSSASIASAIVRNRKVASPNATRCSSARPATHRCPSQVNCW